jgi:cell fate (sporulation/competence/biofilm development) regulator YlbF (YheA/YmcA/DUF963 family)
MSEKNKTRTVQARVNSTEPGIEIFDAYAMAYNLSDSETLRRVIQEWAETIDRTALLEKLREARNNMNNVINAMENRLL